MDAKKRAAELLEAAQRAAEVLAGVGARYGRVGFAGNSPDEVVAFAELVGSSVDKHPSQIQHLLMIYSTRVRHVGIEIELSASRPMNASDLPAAEVSNG